MSHAEGLQSVVMRSNRTSNVQCETLRCETFSELLSCSLAGPLKAYN